MPDSTDTIVGFVGLGRMGLPMCRRLLAGGYSLVVYNRTPGKADPLVAAGARRAASLADLAASCAVIITCLDTVAASSDVFLGNDGLIANARKDAVLIEHSTITARLTAEIAAAARARGVGFLDAPVSGGPEGAAAGTLTIMAGGNVEAFDHAAPVMHTYGQLVHRMGDSGAGTNTKLVNQLLTFVNGSVAAEAIALGQRLGLDLDALATVLRASFGQSRMLERTLDRVKAGNYEAGAALSLFNKDLAIIAEAGADSAMALWVAVFARELEALAERRGLGDKDIAALRLLYDA